MPHVIMINPAPRRRRKRTQGKRTRAKTMANPKRKTPARGRGGRFTKSRRKSTAKRRTYRRNPESRVTRSRAAKKGWRGRRGHSRRRTARTYRRNPSGSAVVRTLKDAMTPALVFPAAAITNDLVYNLIPLPAMLKAGLWQPVGRIGIAAALGLLSSFFLPRKIATFAIGGMVGGVLYESGKAYLASTFPAIPLHGMDGMAAYPSMTYETHGGGSPLGADMSEINGGGSMLGAYVDEGPLGTGSSPVHGMGVYLSNE